MDVLLFITYNNWFYLNKGTFGRHVMMGDCLPREPWIDSWSFQSHLLTFREGREAGDRVQSPIAINLISQACNEASIKLQKRELWRASRLMNKWRCRENGAFRGHGSSVLSILCHMPLFLLALLELYPSIINQ